MKTMIRKLIFTILLTLAANCLSAQGTPPPPPGSHGSGSNQPTDGGGAPLDGGTGTLLLLGGIYLLNKTARRYFDSEDSRE